MLKINEVLENLGIDKGDFAKFYEEVIGKSFTGKVSTISEKNLEQIKQLVKKSPSKKKNELGGETTKVLKSDEILQGGFLSGLGFGKKQEKKLEMEEDEETRENIVLEKPKHEPMRFTDDKPRELSQEFFSQNARKSQDKKGGFGQKRHFDHGVKSSHSQGRPSYQANKPGGGFRSAGTSTQRPVGTSSSVLFANKFDVSKKDLIDLAKDKKGKDDKGLPAGRQGQIVKIAPRVKRTASISANLVKKAEIMIEDKITVKEFSEKMGIPLPEIMKKLIENKIMTGITASLDFDTASLIAGEFGTTVKRQENKLDVQTFMTGDLQAILDLDKEAENLLTRPPIVTIMGHVDHGKTSLLDYLRKTSVAEGEAGGITQSIGASVLEHDGKKICFIDTPGHELFTSLRARGAKLTNIAVIVIAADDSVMPQTIESIGHAKDAGVPIIVAITKIDKPGNKMDQIKTDIAKHGLTPEDWGGDVPVIGISSKTGKGIPELLEAILLQTEMLNLKYNPNRAAVGVVLDAHKDPKQGVVSTIIVMTGTLKVGDVIVAYNTYGKIRRMQNRKGVNVTQATGGDPVQVLGITHLPEPGRIVEVVKSEKEAQNKISLIQDQIKKQTTESAVQQFISQLKSGSKESELRLILKSDGSSSLEALKQAVAGIQLPKNVTVKVIHSSVGHFSDSDLSLAQASSALLLGFNININSLLKKKADSLKIEMKNFDIIYELTDYLNNLLLGMVEIEQHEVMFSKLEVLAIFFTKNKDMTIGGKVIFGKLHGKPKFTVMRGEDILCTGHVVSLHKNKNEVKEVGEGEECGIKVTTGKRIEIGDIIEFFEMQDVVD